MAIKKAAPAKKSPAAQTDPTPKEKAVLLLWLLFTTNPDFVLSHVVSKNPSDSSIKPKIQPDGQDVIKRALKTFNIQNDPLFAPKAVLARLDALATKDLPSAGAFAYQTGQSYHAILMNACNVFSLIMRTMPHEEWGDHCPAEISTILNIWKQN